MIPESLTITERQILTNQFKILSKIDVGNPDYEIKIEILENGFTEQYYEIFDVCTEEIPMNICEETTQILNMFRRINKALRHIDDKEKESLNLNEIKFEGFQINSPHYHYMNFMVEKLELFDEHKDFVYNVKNRDSLKKYRSMLEYQYFLLENDQYEITKNDIIHLIEKVSYSSKILAQI